VLLVTETVALALMELSSTLWAEIIPTRARKKIRQASLPTFDIIDSFLINLV
jgi:hypothetical protein